MQPYKNSLQVVEETVKLIQAGVSKEHTADAEQLFRQYYANIAVEDVRALTPGNLSNTFLNLWSLIQKRTAEETRLNIYRWKPDHHEHAVDRLVIDIVNKNMPFLVDSLVGLLEKHHLKPFILLHPIARVIRDEKGELLRILPAVTQNESDDANYESIIHCEIKDSVNQDQLKRLEKELPEILLDIKLATSDWLKMQASVELGMNEIKFNQNLTDDQRAEFLKFLEWIQDHHFTFLGYGEFNFIAEEGNAVARITKETMLGLNKNPKYQGLDDIFPGITLNQHTLRYVLNPMPIMIQKSSHVSTVHRTVQMDCIAVKKFDSKGKVTGIHLYTGLFTSEAYDSSARDVPLLRRKVESIIKRAGLSPLWHDGKALTHILDSLPRDELFQANEEELTEMGLQILEVQQRQHVTLLVRRDLFGRFLSCLVYIPSNRFDSELTEKMRQLIQKETGHPCVLIKALFGGLKMALAHYRVDIRSDAILEFDQLALERKLSVLSQSWEDGLRVLINNAYGEIDSVNMVRKYTGAFTKAYQEDFTPEEAFNDLRYFETALADGAQKAKIYRLPDTPSNVLRMKIYKADTPLFLSDVLPIIENLDLRVLTEVPYRLSLSPDERTIWMHDCELQSRGDAEINMETAQTKYLETLEKIWSGHTFDGQFNRLVLRANLSWRECLLCYAYTRYLRQLHFTFSETYLADTLLKHHTITTLLVELFEARFDPNKIIHSNEPKLIDLIETALNLVESADEDRILRAYFNLIRATVRTNYYQHNEDGEYKTYISFKIDCRLVEEMPLPKPLYEIFVFSPYMEAVHLRGGKVARGGIRWSDRMEDYRTEILGLMKAQMVKNTVIVPVGSKGGFIVKKDLSNMSREEKAAEVVHCYQTMMCGMLDLTDNIVNEVVVPPSYVVRYDEDDTYLVVAADKGTATFSDYANAVSQKYHFWLGDAFASGGSNGYDHKKMAITARGAWESVRQHFRLLSINADTTEITVVGVGDMAGDVFGNGMLLSRHIKLIAAFNHAHIFIDPNPNPQMSFEERQRLFTMPRSTWMDYNKEVISSGGGVFERKAKFIVLTPEMQELLNINEMSITPTHLIQKILRAKTDLLWFGGIGTFVKASTESDADVGDRLNDALRVNANQLRAKVVGEGANLGVTQRGRIEYARTIGGRINTDALDNSAGVDCSDHEVNIKILLNPIVTQQKLSFEQRNETMVEMTEDVAQHVLRNNQLQNQIMSMMEFQGVKLLDSQRNLMRTLEKEGRLNRQIEFLPDENTLAEYQKNNISLTRPELAILLAYAKIHTYEEALKTKVLNHAMFHKILTDYFPNMIRKQFEIEINTHFLRREIIATKVINTIINRMGATFFNDMQEKTGRSVEDIICAYFISQEILDIRDMWLTAESLHEKVGAQNQMKVLLDCWSLVRRVVMWFLRSYPRPLDLDETPQLFKKGMMAIEPHLEECLDEESCNTFRENIRQYVDMGLEENFSKKIASLNKMTTFPDIILLADQHQYPFRRAAEIYFQIGKVFGFTGLRRQLDLIHSNNQWHRRAISNTIEDLYVFQFDLAAMIITFANKSNLSKDMEGYRVVEIWIKEHPDLIRKVDNTLTEVDASGSLDFPQLMVLMRELRQVSQKVESVE